MIRLNLAQILRSIFQDFMQKGQPQHDVVGLYFFVIPKPVDAILQFRPTVCYEVATAILFILWKCGITQSSSPSAVKRWLPVESTTVDPFDNNSPGNEEKGVVADQISPRQTRQRQRERTSLILEFLQIQSFFALVSPCVAEFTLI